ncbi:response regulator transcription factor [Psychroserpens sp.]|uniref:response regulator transcription factor n=1 Tax=Psychroserpens sp. TaxID=2020870 RepID=UPI001B0DAAA9|nr:response regulator transcription factor [Psychroserpens sp.]MBO6606020.1 response regulator transcription factor [Psychroserpens sp.]MBO6652609.1 response regulator transcription factor [Psychroserpens sp.]MBO6681619.1 response regulator transcription factor [Psychroserpens sp.]MBO6749394.1 response regulator transcription factor [Psychroserpens sp.]MBO6914160.1 response regulator transcription factor [Psychroserpens sp.]
MNVKIAIVDDNTFLINTVKEKLSFFEDFNVKFTAMNGSELLTQLEVNHNLDLILMDIEMPVLNGIESTEIVKNKYPHIKIIMLTTFDNDEHIFNAIKAGADGYLLKEINAKDLHDGIIDTLNGGAAMNPSIALKTLKLLRNPLSIENEKDKEIIKLSNRETEVLEHLSKGLNYVQIAENLILSTGTVRKHIENIYRKLQVHNKMEAVQKAKRNNLI